MWASIRSYIGVPYKWGGDNAVSVDCGGFTQEIYWSMGFLDDTLDRGSAGQYEYWKELNRIENVMPEDTDMFGWLVFFRRKLGSGPIIHVEICLDNIRCVGARGRKGINTPEEAEALDAFVKIRPIFHNRRSHEVVGFADPWS